MSSAVIAPEPFICSAAASPNTQLGAQFVRYVPLLRQTRSAVSRPL